MHVRPSHLILITAAAFACQAANLSALSGRVVDQTGATVANASVVWWAMPTPVETPRGLAPALPQPTALGHAVTDGSGQFQVSGLQNGIYGVCVTSLAKPSHLSTCEWRNQAVTVAVSDAAAPLNLAVQDGAVLTFQISDAKGRLTLQNTSVIVSAAGGGFAHARITSLTPTSAMLTVSVPFDSDIAVVLQAPGPVSDANGAAVPLGVPAMMMTISSEVSKTVILTVN